MIGSGPGLQPWTDQPRCVLTNPEAKPFAGGCAAQQASAHAAGNAMVRGAGAAEVRRSEPLCRPLSHPSRHGCRFTRHGCCQGGASTPGCHPVEAAGPPGSQRLGSLDPNRWSPSRACLRCEPFWGDNSQMESLSVHRPLHRARLSSDRTRAAACAAWATPQPGPGALKPAACRRLIATDCGLLC